MSYNIYGEVVTNSQYYLPYLPVPALISVTDGTGKIVAQTQSVISKNTNTNQMQNRFNFPQLFAGMYTVTISAGGYTFSPDSIIVTQDTNFPIIFTGSKSSAPTFQIYGGIVLNNNPFPYSAMVTIKDATGNVITSQPSVYVKNSAGVKNTFYFLESFSGTVTVECAAAGYTFTPQTVTANTPLPLVFQAQGSGPVSTYQIYGQINATNVNENLEGSIQVIASDTNGNQLATTGVSATKSASQYTFIFSQMLSGTVIVSVDAPAFTVEPSSITVTQNTTLPITFSIAPAYSTVMNIYVYDQNNKPMNNVAIYDISNTQNNVTTVTNTYNGYAQLTVSPSDVIKAVYQGYVFTPQPATDGSYTVAGDEAIVQSSGSIIFTGAPMTQNIIVQTVDSNGNPLGNSLILEYDSASLSTIVDSGWTDATGTVTLPFATGYYITAANEAYNLVPQKNSNITISSTAYGGHIVQVNAPCTIVYVGTAIETITIVAQDSQGNAIAGATIAKGGIPLTYTQTGQTVQTDSTGSATITVAYGDQITVTDPDFSFAPVASSNITISGNSAIVQGSGTITFIGTPVTEQITVKVVDKSGNPIAGATVTY
jgi:protocatechuate 3,4-dioxygenase beta subunit